MTNEMTLPAPAGARAFNYDAVDDPHVAHEAKAAAVRIRARLNEQAKSIIETGRELYGFRLIRPG